MTSARVRRRRTQTVAVGATTLAIIVGFVIAQQSPHAPESARTRVAQADSSAAHSSFNGQSANTGKSQQAPPQAVGTNV